MHLVILEKPVDDNKKKRMYHNNMIHLEKNNLLTIIAQHLPDNPVIIEAGAFTGNDTVIMAQTWPQSTIYAFEPVPEIFKQLYNNTKNFENVYPIQLALGAHDGTAQLWPSPHPKKEGQFTQASSLLQPKERLAWSNIQFNDPITVQTITLASWMQQEHLDHIDFLWLDTQGYELPIMQASADVIKKIPLIYTEVHFTEAYAGQAQYHELKNWLESIGFTLIGKDFHDETNWFFGNALFKNNKFP